MRRQHTRRRKATSGRSFPAPATKASGLSTTTTTFSPPPRPTSLRASICRAAPSAAASSIPSSTAAPAKMGRDGRRAASWMATATRSCARLILQMGRDGRAATAWTATRRCTGATPPFHMQFILMHCNFITAFMVTADQDQHDDGPNMLSASCPCSTSTSLASLSKPNLRPPAVRTSLCLCSPAYALSGSCLL